MFSQTIRVRIGAVLIAVGYIATYGCARPLPPPESRALPPAHRAQHLPRAPYIVADDRPLVLAGPTSAKRENYEEYRKTFEKGRQERMDQRQDAELEKMNLTRDCVIYTMIIFSPICIVVVPLAYTLAYTGSSLTKGRHEPYLPAVPSDAEISRIGNLLGERLRTAAITKQLVSQAYGVVQAESGFPRLMVRAESAVFDTDMTITVSFVVQAEPSAGEFLPETVHRYQVGYQEGNDRRFGKELDGAQAALVKSILSTYRW